MEWGFQTLLEVEMVFFQSWEGRRLPLCDWPFSYMAPVSPPWARLRQKTYRILRVEQAYVAKEAHSDSVREGRAFQKKK